MGGFSTPKTEKKREKKKETNIYPGMGSTVIITRPIRRQKEREKA